MGESIISTTRENDLSTTNISTWISPIDGCEIPTIFKNPPLIEIVSASNKPFIEVYFQPRRLLVLNSKAKLNLIKTTASATPKDEHRSKEIDTNIRSFMKIIYLVKLTTLKLSEPHEEQRQISKLPFLI